MSKPLRKVRKDGELLALIVWAKEFGFVCEKGKTHLVFRRPNTQPVFVASTPSCWRARKNNRRDLKHAMIESEQRQQARADS